MARDLRLIGLYQGPPPVIHPESEPFWRGLRDGELRIQQCDRCAVRRFPIAPMCWSCGSGDSTWILISPFGHISTAITIHRATGSREWADEVPFVAALVDMRDPVRLPGRVFCGCGLAERRGALVRAAVLEFGAEYAVLCFQHDC